MINHNLVAISSESYALVFLFVCLFKTITQLGIDFHYLFCFNKFESNLKKLMD